MHRNVANLARAADANYLSVLQFALDVLKVKHILSSAITAAVACAPPVDGQRRGLVDHWACIRSAKWAT